MRGYRGLGDDVEYPREKNWTINRNALEETAQEIEEGWFNKDAYDKNDEILAAENQMLKAIDGDSRKLAVMALDRFLKAVENLPFVCWKKRGGVGRPQGCKHVWARQPDICYAKQKFYKLRKRYHKYKRCDDRLLYTETLNMMLKQRDVLKRKMAKQQRKFARQTCNMLDVQRRNNNPNWWTRFKKTKGNDEIDDKIVLIEEGLLKIGEEGCTVNKALLDQATKWHAEEHFRETNFELDEDLFETLLEEKKAWPLKDKKAIGPDGWPAELIKIMKRISEKVATIFILL